MKQEYDFSKGEHGKFYHLDAEFDIPIYLESDISEYMKKIASKKKIDLDQFVNDLLRKNIDLVQSAS